MAYTTLADVLARMDKAAAVATDAVITALIGAADRAIDNFCNRPDGFEANAGVRYYAGNGKAYLLIDECIDIDEVAVKDSVTDTVYVAWTSPTTNMAGDGDWFASTGDRKAPNFNSLPYTMLQVDMNGNETNFTSGAYTGLRGFPRRVDDEILRQSAPTVRVTALWGYSAVAPPEIREASTMQTVIWFKRYEGAMASSLANVDLGTLELFQSLDPAIEFILRLGRYVRPATGRE
jgi:hypothetical protein